MEDKYKSMSAPELAGEDSFIRWITKEENNPQWLQWKQTNPTGVNVIDEAADIVRSLSNAKEESLTIAAKEELWNRINTAVTRTSASSRKYALIKWGMAAAATLALVIWINSSQPTRIYTSAGNQTEFLLPESSEVTVNAGSDVSYKKNFEKDRVIHLSGEAFFKVNPGSTFKVITDYGTVTVLGTSFNVVARPGRFEVSCYTGKVLVENKSNNKAEVSPGEKVFNEENKLDKVSFIPGEVPEWTKGKYRFTDIPLEAVMAEFERQFDVEVDLSPGLEDIPYSGLFEKGNQDTALYMITWPLRLKSETKGNRISITH